MEQPFTTSLLHAQPLRPVPGQKFRDWHKPPPRWQSQFLPVESPQQRPGRLVVVSPLLRTRLHNILTQEIQLAITSRLALAMSQRISPTDKKSPTVGQSQRWLRELVTGLTDELLPEQPTT